LLRDLPPRARWYIVFVIALGAVTFVRSCHGRRSRRCAAGRLRPPLIADLRLQVQFPIASGSNMSVSYVVDIAA
jgi:hypothetical protein